MRSEGAPYVNPSTLKRGVPPPLGERLLFLKRLSFFTIAKPGLRRLRGDGPVPAMSLEPQIRHDMNCNFITGSSCSVTYRKADVYGGMDYLTLSSWVAYAFARIALGNKSGIVCQAEDCCRIRWDVYSRALNSPSLDMGKTKYVKVFP